MRIGNLTILVGADPEIFVKKKGAKFFSSAHGLVSGTKENPTPVENGAVQVDGLALEYNINPASSMKEFVDNNLSVLKQLKELVGDGYTYHPVPTATFHRNTLNAQPAEALELGCEPDFNAWTSAMNPRPNGDNNFRTGAGHIHIGWTEGVDISCPHHLAACEVLIRNCDYILGLGSLLFDKDSKRREMYGAAGAYRPKSYGAEYRVLSNAWLERKELMGWVYYATTKVIEATLEGKSYKHREGEWGKELLGKGKLEDQDFTKIINFLSMEGIQLPPIEYVRKDNGEWTVA